MPVFIPESAPTLGSDVPIDWIVACYCAAWCDTCTRYREKFDALARADSGRADRRFEWIDIEDEPEWLGEEDVDNFPTLVVQYRGRTLFFGPMLPHIGHLERLLHALSPDSATIPVRLPDLGERLRRDPA